MKTQGNKEKKMEGVWRALMMREKSLGTAGTRIPERGTGGVFPQPLEENNSADTLILDVWPPELWENKFLSSKPPSLWSSLSQL